MLDSDGVGVGIKVGNGLELGNPAAVDVIRDGKLPGLVVHFDDDILAEIFERNLLTQARAILPDFVCPLFKLFIMGNAPL